MKKMHLMKVYVGRKSRKKEKKSAEIKLHSNWVGSEVKAYRLESCWFVG